MTRRIFNAALAGAGCFEPRTGTVLRAIYGARVPATLRLAEPPAGPLAEDRRYFELRRYAATDSLLREPILRVFQRAGMAPLRTAGLTFLIPFASLEARAQAWAEVNSDPAWRSLRAELRLAEMTIYTRFYEDPSPKSLPAYISAARSR